MCDVVVGRLSSLLHVCLQKQEMQRCMCMIKNKYRKTVHLNLKRSRYIQLHLKERLCGRLYNM